MMNSAPAKKRGRPVDADLRARRTDEILDTAAKVFAERGYPSTDVQLVADALGVGKGTVYRYFPSKEALFLAAADRSMRRLSEHVNALVADIDEPFERLRTAVHGYLAYFAAHPEAAELLIQERAEFRDRKKPTYFVHRDRNIEPWRELFRKLIRNGQVRKLPVERVMDVLSDLLYGTMFTNYFTGRRRPLQVQADDILDVIFHGILSDAERRRRGR